MHSLSTNELFDLYAENCDSDDIDAFFARFGTGNPVILTIAPATEHKAREHMIEILHFRSLHHGDPEY